MSRTMFFIDIIYPFHCRLQHHSARAGTLELLGLRIPN